MEYYKYDLHVHTAQSSLCARSKGASLVDKYAAAGYSGFVTTDHFIGSPNCSSNEERSWKDKVYKFASGYYDALNRGIQCGFDVFFGFEFFYDNTEFVVLNLTPEKLILLGEQIISDNLAGALQTFRDSGGFIIHVHPFRYRNREHTTRLLPELTDAVEIFNGENIFLWPDANELARKYAKEIGKPPVSGSDLHGDSELITGGMMFPKKICTPEELVHEIRFGHGNLIMNALF